MDDIENIGSSIPNLIYDKIIIVYKYEYWEKCIICI